MNSWANTALYQASSGKHTINVEVETVRDRARGFKRVMCSFGDFEAKNMAEVKEYINLQFQKP